MGNFLEELVASRIAKPCDVRPLGGACRIDVMRKGLPHWPPKVGQPKKSPCICDSKGNFAFDRLVVSKHDMLDWKDLVGC
jgi:hypothetical protein